MRDIAFTLLLVYLCSRGLKEGYYGFLAWIWISMMNPQKISYGFFLNKPVATIAMAVTLIGLVGEKNKGKLFQHPLVGLQILFLFWTVITTLTAQEITISLPGLNKLWKVVLGVILTYPLINTKERLITLNWVLFLSIGFYGIKGGLFTLLTMGNHKVYGPEGTFMSENNATALALLMVMPLGVFLTSQLKDPRLRKLMVVFVALMGVSVLGSNSRGAFLGLGVAMVYWIMKSPGKQRFIAFGVSVFIAAIALFFMPQSYWDRMHTVQTYEKDGSAMGRINAWWCAFNLANHEFMGAGFDYAQPRNFILYAPNPKDIHTAHSIYFQVLGDHGWVGLIIFVAMLVSIWFLLMRVISKTKNNENLLWANFYSKMLQLSLISYMVSGAFLSLPYFDLYWQLVACGVVMNTFVNKELASPSPVSSPSTSNSAPLKVDRGRFLQPVTK